MDTSSTRPAVESFSECSLEKNQQKTSFTRSVEHVWIAFDIVSVGGGRSKATTMTVIILKNTSSWRARGTRQRTVDSSSEVPSRWRRRRRPLSRLRFPPAVRRSVRTRPWPRSFWRRLSCRRRLKPETSRTENRRHPKKDLPRAEYTRPSAPTEHITAKLYTGESAVGFATSSQ